MDDSNKHEFKQILSYSLKPYGIDLDSMPVDEQKVRLRMWWASMERFTIEEVRAGFSMLWESGLNTYGREITAGDIINLMGRGAESKNLEVQAKIEKVIRSLGCDDIFLDDPILLRLLHDEKKRLYSIGQMSEESARFEVKRLVGEYESMQARGIDWYPSALYCEKNPFSYSKTIGDARKALEVSKSGKSRLTLISEGKYSDDIARKGEKKAITRDFGKDEGRKVLSDLKSLTAQKSAVVPSEEELIEAVKLK